MQHCISLTSALAALQAEARLRTPRRSQTRVEDVGFGPTIAQKLSSSAAAPAAGRDCSRGRSMCSASSRQRTTTNTRR
jgi:hypothetical protein